MQASIITDPLFLVASFYFLPNLYTNRTPIIYISITYIFITYQTIYKGIDEPEDS